MPKKTKDQLQTELLLLKQKHRSQNFAVITKTLIRLAAVVVIVYLITDAIKYLAGKTTYADIFFSILSNIKINTTITWSATAAASIWAYSERRLRRNKTKYLAKRIEELESMIDPKRSTSNLTVFGDTNPKDR